MIVKIVGLIFAIGIDGRDERNDPVGMAGASVGWQKSIGARGSPNK